MALVQVRNFAIDVSFLERVVAAEDAADLERSTSSNHLWGMTLLHEESLPKPLSETFSAYDRVSGQDWEVLRRIPETMTVAVNIAADIMKFTQVTYAPDRESFVEPDRRRTVPFILEHIFDYPDFQPYRYACCILRKTLNDLHTRYLTEEGGELAYGMDFQITSIAFERPTSIDIAAYADPVRARER